MKRYVVCAALLALTGCEVSDTMKATTSMDKKMDKMTTAVDKTNDGMVKMNKSVDRTNDGMDTMIGEVRKTNDSMDDMIGEVRDTNRGMGDMIREVRSTNREIKRTNEAVHKQAIAQAMEVMFSEQNTSFEDPTVPMMPAGKTLAAELTAEEMAELLGTWLTEINTSIPKYSDQVDGQWPANVVAEFDHAKKVKMIGAMVVAGLAPQRTIAELIVDQAEGGRFQEEAHAVLMFRYMFIHDILFMESIVNRGKLKGPGGIEAAIGYAQEMEDISTLPSASQVRVKISGFLNPDRNFEMSLEGGQTKGAWERLNRAFANDLEEKYKSTDHPQSAKVRRLQEIVASHL